MICNGVLIFKIMLDGNDVKKRPIAFHRLLNSHLNISVKRVRKIRDKAPVFLMRIVNWYYIILFFTSNFLIFKKT